MVVQQFLRQNGVEKLRESFGIRVTYHASLPLMILNYDQIESPKDHDIVRECRALLLRSDNYELVARSFRRFFNYGEIPNNDNFDWKNFSVSDKEDGSLVVMYWFDNQWNFYTRNSFTDRLMDGYPFEWQEIIRKAIGNFSGLDPELSYVWEFCSPYNRIVRDYPEPTVFLLTAFRGEAELTLKEFEELDVHQKKVKVYQFNSIDDVIAHIDVVSQNDETYEGVVLRDSNNRRLKVKSPRYLRLHRIFENNSVCLPKNVLALLINGEADEAMVYFPQIRPIYDIVFPIYENWLVTLDKVWNLYKELPRKEFALAIKKEKTGLDGVFFYLYNNRGMSPQNVLKDCESYLQKLLKEKLHECLSTPL